MGAEGIRATGMVRELDATSEELRQALADAMGLVPDDDPSVLTVKELAEELDISVWNARKRANGAVEAGRMEKVTVKRQAKDGRVIPLDGYRLLREDDNLA